MTTTILLVEDELELARLVVRELEAASYAVQHAPEGSTALRLFADSPPDVVVLDWMLPGLDGLEVLRRLRQSSPVPVLMLTARLLPASARCSDARNGCRSYWPPIAPKAPPPYDSVRSSLTPPRTWPAWTTSRWI